MMPQSFYKPHVSAVFLRIRFDNLESLAKLFLLSVVITILHKRVSIFSIKKCIVSMINLFPLFLDFLMVQLNSFLLRHLVSFFQSLPFYLLSQNQLIIQHPSFCSFKEILLILFSTFSYPFISFFNSLVHRNFFLCFHNYLFLLLFCFVHLKCLNFGLLLVFIVFRGNLSSLFLFKLRLTLRSPI